ncbi:MAG: OmpA family protein [Microscillaceae bacterium]|nr:OmpA family protein [Microscillaceae bacterium]
MKNYYLLIFILFICAYTHVMGQDNTAGQNLRINSDTARDDKNILYFRFINEYPHYYNKEELAAIDQLLQAGKLEKAYEALYAYVMRFGIKNFQKDAFLLWRLGKLAEQLKYIDKAKIFYNLVIKHHPEGKKMEYRLYYDSLNRNNLDYYLPVEYYYTYANASSNIDTLDIPESIYTDVGDSVNSVYNDYAPVLSGNDLVLVFTSQRKQVRNGMRYQADEDFYFSRKADSLYVTQTEEGSRIDTLPWTEAKPFPGGINSQFNEGSLCISRDGRTIYFARCQSPDGYGDCDIFVSFRKDDNSWTSPQNLGLNVNTISWESQPALSHTGDTLFFASDRLGGFGGSDIYYTYKTDFRQQGQDTLWQWAPAQNIGPIINTRYNEVSPFYHPKHEILYFSSDGQLVNFGGFDIYKSYRVRAKWAEPRNIGPLVNYNKDEYYFTIDSKSTNLYYAKLTKTRFFDYAVGDTVVKESLNIHTAFLPMEAQPLATTVLEGQVTDSLTGAAFEGIISIIDLDNGIEVAPKYIRPDGSYRFDLIRNNNYLVIITGDDFLRIEKQFLLKGDTTLNISAPSIQFKKWKFEAVEFDENSSEITDKMVKDLNKLVLFLSDHPNLGLKISGHTDSQGSDTDNMNLSQARADAIKNYIISKGKFKDSRIEAIGYGSRNPIITPEVTEDDRRINRRVEFEIVKLY